MKKSILLITVVAISMFLTAGTAFALNFNYPGLSGTSYTDTNIFPGVDMTISATGGSLTWDSSDNGIGIQDDEVSGNTNEALSFSFTKTMNIDDFYIVDLFPDDNGAGAETGLYSIEVNGTPYGPQSFGPGNNAGDFTLPLNTQVDMITFFADDNGFKDFAVAGFKGEPVPEPGTIVLLGLGLVGVAAYRRKARK